MFMGSDVSLVGLATRWPRANAGFSFAGGALPAEASLSRATPATRYNASGVLESIAANGARFDYDPATLVLRGLLIEPARTNGIRSSQGFAGADWTRRGSFTTTENAIAAPDGTTTGALWAGLLGGPSGDIYETALGAASRYPNTTGCVPSLWIRRVSAAGTLLVQNAFNGTPGGAFSVNLALLAAGAWTRVFAGHPAVTVINPFVSSAAGALGINLICTAGAPISVHVWGIQVEAGPAPSSYVPTANAAATRAADVLVLNWASKGVPDGSHMMRYNFDDGSSQDVATTVTGGTATVPTTLNRPWIRSVARV